MVPYAARSRRCDITLPSALFLAYILIRLIFYKKITIMFYTQMFSLDGRGGATLKTKLFFIFGTVTLTAITLSNVYKTVVCRGCHSFYDIGMDTVMVKTVGRQDLSDENEPISHPISCHLDPPDREVVDVDTTERKTSGDTVVVRGLVIESTP